MIHLSRIALGINIFSVMKKGKGQKKKKKMLHPTPFF